MSRRRPIDGQTAIGPECPECGTPSTDPHGRRVDEVTRRVVEVWECDACGPFVAHAEGIGQ